MNRIAMRTAVAGIVLLAGACGDEDGGTLPTENEAPVAEFALPDCIINVPCGFTSTSTDDVEVTAWSWDFNGDGNTDATTEDASFTYTAAGTYTVGLTVRDAEDLSATKTGTITIDPVDPGPVDPGPVDPTNTPPTAGFTSTCDEATCSFTSTSSDAAPGTLVAYAWTFGDGSTADVPDPSHTYTVAAPTDFTVTLTVTDNEGATDSETQTVSVTPPPVPNVPPTAGFTSTCDAGTCQFTSTSTDPAPGTIVTYAWDFGDGAASDAANPSHAYAITAPTDFTVTLTVTDDEGATDAETQTISVSPPPPSAQGCTTSGIHVDCFLDVTEPSIIRLRLLGLSCDLNGERVVIPPPIGDQVFLGVCNRSVGDSTMIFGGPLDEPIVYEAGSQVRIRFTQGTARASEPAPAAPAGNFTGSFPNWTLNFEDGDNAGTPGEPDFADVVLGVQALPAP